MPQAGADGTATTCAPAPTWSRDRLLVSHAPAHERPHAEDAARIGAQEACSILAGRSRGPATSADPHLVVLA